MKGDLRISFFVFSKKEKEDPTSSLQEEASEYKDQDLLEETIEDESDEIKRIFRPLQVLQDRVK